MAVYKAKTGQRCKGNQHHYIGRCAAACYYHHPAGVCAWGLVYATGAAAAAGGADCLSDAKAYGV